MTRLKKGDPVVMVSGADRGTTGRMQSNNFLNSENINRVLLWAKLKTDQLMHFHTAF